MSSGRPADVVIVGGGIIGLAIAAELAERGKSVTLLERGIAGQECTAASAGMLAPLVESTCPGPFLMLALESLRRYSGFLARLAMDERFELRMYSRGMLQVARTEEERLLLQQSYTWQREFEPTLQWSERPATFEPLLTGAIAAIQSSSQRAVNPTAVIAALLQRCRRLGVAIEEHVDVTRIDSQAGLARAVDSAERRVEGQQLILCTGAWTGMLSSAAGASIPVRPVRGQSLSMFAPEGTLRHIVRAEGIYVVPREDGRLIIGATTEEAGFAKTVKEASIEALMHDAFRMLPTLRRLARFEKSWCGLRPGTPDEMPVIGVVPGFSNLFVASGHYRNGVLLAPVTSVLVADMLISGEAPAQLEAFSPARFVG